MTEYIGRQAVLDELDEDIEEFVECDYALKTAKKYIKKIPPADVRPVKHGHWQQLEGDSRFMCSVCKWKENVPTIMGEPTVWDYCPSCGARMGEQNEY